MRILVTGGAGFIGSHIVDAYLAAGHDVAVVDSLWSHGGGRREQVPDAARFYQLDVRDLALREVIGKEQPEVINHHAAQHSVKLSTDDPAYDAQVNVLGLINVLTAAREAGVRKVIFPSSAATYGTVERLPIDEQTPQHPESPYGITKMVSEHYLHFWQHEYGLSYTALRYSNVYGPRQDPNGEAGVVAIFARRFLDHQPVRIYWDGEQTRDYVYAGDVARANVLALSGAENQILCIGSGVATSVNAIHRGLAEITGFEAPVEHLPRRAGDPRDSLFNPARAAEVLGWRPEIPFHEGLRRTVQWFKDHPEQ
ncbi:MAG TPA: NAD-dependent epimerase/dehydratase family protein [Chloroflexota bacterium]|jgi:UDP-glucose 4-epimerase|nr:NAD-dependent epimerase/dehydratase family protein [Chloroflexota bacterium]